MQVHTAPPTANANRNLPCQAPQVAEWAFEAGTGQISAFDRDGRRLMAIPTSPLFGVRLAAAFGWRRVDHGAVVTDRAAFLAHMQ